MKNGWKYENFDAIKKSVWQRHIDELELDDARFVVFGCGDIGKQFLQNISQKQRENILCFCDNNAGIWGEEMDEIPIMSPASAVEKHIDHFFVIAIARNTEQIKNQLVELGVQENVIKILSLYDDGEASKDYLEERLGDRYELDRNYPAEASTPVVIHRDRSDHRDFRIYVESGLSNSFQDDPLFFESELIDEYERVFGEYISVNMLPVNVCDTNARIMIACSHMDYRQIDDYDHEYYVPIQVGKALTDIVKYELNDASGESISDRNYNYCECSALYWAWKNGFANDYDYIGLRHYRRKMDITREQICSLKLNGVDIVHVDPSYHDNIKKCFSYHTKNPQDWDVMKEVIRDMCPEYYDSMLKYGNQHFVCGYNMCIMKRKVYDEYCEFLFRVLMGVEEYYLKICDRRDRYLGFLAENLLNVFCIKNKDKYKHIIAKVIPM